VKLKSRQIVSSWPRGRSTSRPPIPHGSSFEILWGRSNWNSIDLFDLQDEMIKSLAYHDTQQDMFDHHISSYRHPTPAWLAWHIRKHGGLVIATVSDRPGHINLGVPPVAWRFRLGEPVEEEMEVDTE
jgi:hypothetical protein